MNNEKNINYYRILLHKDNIVLLVIAIIFSIILVSLSFSEESVPPFLVSIMVAIVSIILICNKKKNKKFVGILGIITSCIMILNFVLEDRSTFGFIYLFLGIFYLIHSILYLIKLKYFSANLIDNK